MLTAALLMHEGKVNLKSKLEEMRSFMASNPTSTMEMTGAAAANKDDLMIEE